MQFSWQLIFELIQQAPLKHFEDLKNLIFDILIEKSRNLLPHGLLLRYNRVKVLE